jgi:pimeloyl-ACP methyl ester carboxylesterase
MPSAITPQSKFAEVNGVRLHYLLAGAGDPVVLLHGFAESSHMWLPLMAKLADKHTVIAPDLRGFGQSSAPADGYTKAAMARDIHALVQSLNYDRIRLVGHDIGLMVAYAYAAQYPTEVDRLVLMEAFLPGVGDWNSVFLLRDLWHFHFYGTTPLALVTGRERIYLEHFWNDFAADPAKSVSEADRQFYASEYAKPDHMKAGMEVFRAFPPGRRGIRKICKNQAADADAGSFRGKSRRSVPDRARQDGGDRCRGRARQRIGALADGRSPGPGDPQIGRISQSVEWNETGSGSFLRLPRTRSMGAASRGPFYFAWGCFRNFCFNA